MKYNVIIPFRGRHEYLSLCLRSLELAAKGKDVNITLVTDEPFKFKKDEHYDVKTSLYIAGKYFHKFNKSYLLNTGLGHMRQEFDYVSIVDCDMIYNPNFFDTISTVDENTWFISGGWKLKSVSHTLSMEDVFSNYTAINLRHINKELIEENQNELYPSQITLHKELYHKVLDILQTKELYHEGFIGWGGEDSYLSLLSRACDKAGLFKRHYDKNMWYHLWHTPAKDNANYNEKQHEKNVRLLYKKDEENQEKIRTYSSRK